VSRGKRIPVRRIDVLGYLDKKKGEDGELRGGRGRKRHREVVKDMRPCRRKKKRVLTVAF